MAPPIYAGIGSRKTPSAILRQMVVLGAHLARRGWLLRSGGAAGADRAFEVGARLAGGAKEIWLPWLKYNEHSSLLLPKQAAFDLAATIHPGWKRLSQGAKRQHARNCHQVLGADLKTPARLVVCWTPNGEEVGGTRTALVLAKDRGIRIVNLAVEDWHDMTAEELETRA